MASYQLIGIETATIAQDRTRFDVSFRTDKGPLTITISAEHLDALVTTLEGLEYQASLLDPTTGPKPGEAAQVRVKIVEHHQIGRADVNGVPSVLLGLKSAQVFRWFAFDAQRATAAQQALAAEIPKLQREADPH